MCQEYATGQDICMHPDPGDGDEGLTILFAMPAGHPRLGRVGSMGSVVGGQGCEKDATEVGGGVLVVAGRDASAIV